jgi:hypothetical protein
VSCKQHFAAQEHDSPGLHLPQRLHCIVDDSDYIRTQLPGESMAERPPTTPKRDTQDQGEQDGRRWMQWFTSKRNCSMLLWIITSVLQNFKYMTTVFGVATDEDWTELLQSITNLDPQCFLELLLSVLDLLSALPMIPVQVAAVTSKFAADNIMSTLEWKSETCATLFPVLLAILFLAVFVVFTKQLWLALAPRHTKTDTLKHQQNFANLRYKIMFYTFMIVVIINIWKEMKSAFLVLDFEEILNVKTTKSWLCSIIDVERHSSDSLLASIVLYTLFVIALKAPDSPFEQELVVMFTSKCVQFLYIHCIDRNFDKWSYVALGVIFVAWCAKHRRAICQRKGIKLHREVLPLLPCFLPVKVGIWWFFVTGVFGLVYASTSVLSFQSQGNEKYERVLDRLWFTEAMMTLRP